LIDEEIEEDNALATTLGKIVKEEAPPILFLYVLICVMLQGC
jgi:hypothetical protein